MQQQLSRVEVYAEDGVKVCYLHPLHTRCEKYNGIPPVPRIPLDSHENENE